MQCVQTKDLSEETLQKRYKVIWILGIVEIILGSFMVVFGIYTVIVFGSWEGSGCGIWVIVAGGLGIRAGGKSSTPILITIHIGFSIVGIIASIVLAWVTGVAAVILYQIIPGLHAVMSIMCFISCVSAVILIVSAVYCCISNPLGCCGGCGGQQVNPGGQHQQQVNYNTTNAN